jgi:hypothetical protein
VNQRITDEKKKREGNGGDNIVNLARKHGIIIEDNQYYKMNNGDVERWSNFIMTPVFHIRDNNNASRVFKLTNVYGTTTEMEFKQEELIGLNKFQQKIESVDNYIWHGSAKNLNTLKEILYQNVETADKISVLGWNKEFEIYAFGNAILADNNIIEVDEMGLARYDNHVFYLPALSRMHRNEEASYQFERSFLYKKVNAFSLQDFVKKYVDLFGDNAKVAFAFLLAAVFRDIIFDDKEFFPALNVFGPQGSGKTSLATSLQSLFVANKTKPSSLTQTSIPAMNYMVSNVVDGLVVLDEYKNDLHPQKIDFLKNSWNGTGRVKMTGEGFNKPIITQFTSAIIFCGQEKPCADIALFSRVIHLTYSTNKFSTEDKRKFEEFKDLCSRGNTHLLVEILKFRDAFKSKFSDMFATCKKELTRQTAAEQIQDRILDNWSIILAAFRALESELQITYSYADLYKVAVEKMRFQNNEISTTSENNEFWKMVNALHMSGRIVSGAHYRIKEFKSIRTSEMDEARIFEKPTKILFLNFDMVQNLLAQRSTGELRIDLASFKSYLKMQSTYLGTKQTRFNVLKPNGDLDIEYDTANQRKKLKQVRPIAMCFDYEMYIPTEK